MTCWQRAWNSGWNHDELARIIHLQMLVRNGCCRYDWLDDQGYSERLGIRFRPHVLFPDICLAAAAFVPVLKTRITGCISQQQVVALWWPFCLDLSLAILIHLSPSLSTLPRSTRGGECTICWRKQIGPSTQHGFAKPSTGKCWNMAKDGQWTDCVKSAFQKLTISVI